MSKLICVSGANKGDEFPVTEGITIVGRNPNCGVILFDKKCSRQHCQVSKNGAYFSIEDLGSSNGTLLNGKKLIKKKSFKTNDRFQIGNTVLSLSKKGSGDLVEQTATDIATELRGTTFRDMMGKASADVSKHQHQHHDHYKKKPKGIVGFFKNLFK